MAGRESSTASARNRTSAERKSQMKLRKLTGSILILTAMTFGSGCAIQPPIQIVGECVWVERITWTTDEADAIVDHAPEVARQLLRHNAKVGAFCE